MTYHEYPIQSRLKPFVKMIYSLEGQPGADDMVPWRILPDTCVELVFHIETPYMTTFANGKKVLQPHSFVMAQMQEFVEIQPTGRTSFIAVRFTAAGAHHFFPLPVSSFSGGQIPLSEVWVNQTFQLEDQLHTALGIMQKVEAVQRSLIVQLDRNGVYDHLVAHCLQRIYSQKGLIVISDLAAQTGISTRQLLRRFDRCIGASPKEFSRVVKFLDACRRLRDGQNVLLTDVAYASGYADQAHFIHDFRTFSGLTPGEFIHTEHVFF